MFYTEKYSNFYQNIIVSLIINFLRLWNNYKRLIYSKYFFNDFPNILFHVLNRTDQSIFQLLNPGSSLQSYRNPFTEA